MKETIYILGAGGFGREVYGWLNDAVALGGDLQFGGFLDDNLEALEGFTIDARVVGPISGFQPAEGDRLVCGIGQVGLKQAICRPLLEAGARFLSVVHPSATIGRGVHLGRGVVICPRVTVTCDCELGDLVMINCHSTVGHDVRIGAYSTLSAHCDLTGHSELAEGVFMGSGARVLPGKTVGAGAVLGAGAVVIRSVAAGAKVFGNPAREFA